VKHLIEVITDTHPSGDQKAESEAIRECLLAARVSMELGFMVTQVRQPSGLAQP
jgi:hypothetical protein